jgi:hypothetical protein
MGRPLNKKYIGGRNRGADGNFGAANTAGDADLGGTNVSGVGSITAGAYTGTAPTLQFPIPLLAGNGGIRAQGTPYFAPVAGQITVGGTATMAYLASEVLTQATTGVTFTPTLSTIAGNTITNTNGTAVTVTSGSYIKGTSFITGGTVTTTSGLAANTTYYVAATTSSSTTVTLASSYANALAGTAITFTGGSTAISNGSVTIGTVAGPVTSAVYASGTVTTLNTTALAVTSASGGAGQTITVAQWGIAGATVTNAGDGYVASSTNTITISAATAEAALTVGTVTVGTTGNFTFSTAQVAGTFWVGQIIKVSGTISGTTWTNPTYSDASYYVVTATNGTSTVTLAGINNATGLPRTDGATTAGTVTGLTFTTASTLTVNTTTGLVPLGQKIAVTAGSGGPTTGTYHVISVNSSTNKISIASSYANFFTGTYATYSTGAVTGTTFVGSQHAVININGGTVVSAGSISATFATEVTTGYTGRYASIVGMAITGTNGVLRQDADLIKQENTQRFKVETQDGIAYCKLVTALPTATGQVAINATDSVGGTYWVSKITNRRCRVTRNTGTQFADGVTVNWTFGSAVANVSVKIDNV